MSDGRDARRRSSTRAEALYRDYRLGAVREWKERTGGLAIGFMPIYVPRELLHAQGVLPVGLMGGGDDLEIIRGDAFYQSYICHIPRSTIELGLNGSLDCLDGMLFPAICDVIRNLSGMWQMLVPGQARRATSTCRRTSTRELGGALLPRASSRSSRASSTARGARPLRRRRRCARRSRVYNENRRARARALRAAPRRALEGADRASSTSCCAPGLCCRSRSSRAMLARLPRRCAGRRRRASRWTRRACSLTGSFCEQPPLGLIKTLERAGLLHRRRRLRAGAPLDPRRRRRRTAIRSTTWSRRSSTTRSRARRATSATDEKGARPRRARRARARAEGVLFCAPSFCDPALLDQPMAVTARRDAPASRGPRSSTPRTPASSR